MKPVITSVNDVNVVCIQNIGGIVPVFITPEKTLTIKGTGFNTGSAIAAIGLNEVGTLSVNASVRIFNNGKDVNDIFKLFDGVIDIDEIFHTIDDIMNVGTKKADILRAPNEKDLEKDPAKAKPVDQLSAYVPSLWEFQTTDLDLFGFKCKYERNTIVLPFAICVWDFTTSTNSIPIILAAILPPPKVGKPHMEGRRVTIGAVPGPSSDITDHLGARGPNGEVRWYDSSMLTELSSLNIRSFFGTYPTNSSFKAMLATVFEKLAVLRNEGEFITPLDWHNEGVQFDLLKKHVFGTAGLAVIWRDDLPSLPVPIVNLTCDCSNKDEHDEIQARIQEAACKLWSFIPRINLNVPILPGQVVTFGLQKLAAGLDTFLAKLLDSNERGITVRFKFTANYENVKITKVSSDPELEISPNEYSVSAVPMTVDPENPLQIRILAVPELVPDEKPAIAKTITIKLYAEITFPMKGSPCVFSDIQIGPSITFNQMPLAIPTIAIFFTGSNCGRIPLILLPNDTNIIPKEWRGYTWDIKGITPQGKWKDDKESRMNMMNNIRINILSALVQAKNILFILKNMGIKFPLMNQLEDVLTLLISNSAFVVNTTGTVIDLRDYAGFQAIEAVLLIGPPPSEFNNKSIRCYRTVGGTGNDFLQLTIPDNKCIAGLDLQDPMNSLSISTSIFDGKDPTIISKITTIPELKDNGWSGQIASIYFK